MPSRSRIARLRRSCHRGCQRRQAPLRSWDRSRPGCWRRSCRSLSRSRSHPQPAITRTPLLRCAHRQLRSCHRDSPLCQIPGCRVSGRSRPAKRRSCTRSFPSSHRLRPLTTGRPCRYRNCRRSTSCRRGCRRGREPARREAEFHHRPRCRTDTPR